MQNIYLWSKLIQLHDKGKQNEFCIYWEIFVYEEINIKNRREKNYWVKETIRSHIYRAESAGNLFNFIF